MDMIREQVAFNDPALFLDRDLGLPGRYPDRRSRVPSKDSP
jgi:hypothetical protein